MHLGFEVVEGFSGQCNAIKVERSMARSSSLSLS